MRFDVGFAEPLGKWTVGKEDDDGGVARGVEIFDDVEESDFAAAHARGVVDVKDARGGCDRGGRWGGWEIECGGDHGWIMGDLNEKLKDSAQRGKMIPTGGENHSCGTQQTFGKPRKLPA